MDFISRLEANPLIKEELIQEIMQGAVEQSTALQLMRRLPNMSSSTLSMPVLETLPMAYWVNGDTGFKKTSKVAWDKKTIYAEEVAVIIPIPDRVISDARGSGYDIWANIRPLIVAEFGRVVDEAIFFGVNKPSTWRDSVVETARKAGAEVTSTGDLYEDIYGEEGTIAKVELSGYIPNAHLAGVQILGKLRSAVDAIGRPMFVPAVEGPQLGVLLGNPLHTMRNGAWDNEKAKLITGDFNEAMYSIREDIDFKLLTEASIFDPTTKELVYALAQQDMSALRVTMRMGWEIPNPVNALAEDRATRTPFSVLV